VGQDFGIFISSKMAALVRAGSFPNLTKTQNLFVSSNFAGHKSIKETHKK
jgi:hypothetical protein